VYTYITSERVTDFKRNRDGTARLRRRRSAGKLRS
jgi:hypothetical protein